MNVSPSPKGTKEPSPRKYVPAIGRRIDEDDVRQIDAQDRYETSRTRDRLAYLILATLLVALAAAAIYGIRTDSFAPLGQVWAIGGPFAGGIVAYYFNRNRRDSG